jgi:hypothetical protein
MQAVCLRDKELREASGGVRGDVAEERGGQGDRGAHQFRTRIEEKEYIWEES